MQLCVIHFVDSDIYLLSDIKLSMVDVDCFVFRAQQFNNFSISINIFDFFGNWGYKMKT